MSSFKTLQENWTNKLNGTPNITFSFNRERWFLIIKLKNFQKDFIGDNPDKLLHEAIEAGSATHNYFHTKKFDDENDFATKIKEYRNKHRITQVKVARKLNMAQSTYAEYENRNIELSAILYDDFIQAINDLVAENEKKE